LEQSGDGKEIDERIGNAALGTCAQRPVDRTPFALDLGRAALQVPLEPTAWLAQHHVVGIGAQSNDAPGEFQDSLHRPRAAFLRDPKY
jgi:hypothetical protein